MTTRSDRPENRLTEAADLTVGTRVWLNYYPEGHPPAAIWTITSIEPEPGLHLIVERADVPHTARRTPIVSVRRIPTP